MDPEAALYDDAAFFAGYQQMRTAGAGLNEDLEQPALRALGKNAMIQRILEIAGLSEDDRASICADQVPARATKPGPAGGGWSAPAKISPQPIGPRSLSPSSSHRRATRG
ncbi:hypothetical protein [Catenulispora sp. GP43]|uniref:hypothetical protein n=1 Tax=Catenulispora sp. GP43 TaxID=3156263 RepID=UPI0035174848